MRSPRRGRVDVDGALHWSATSTAANPLGDDLAYIGGFAGFTVNFAHKSNSYTVREVRSGS
jgi:hypothetical protein